MRQKTQYFPAIGQSNSILIYLKQFMNARSYLKARSDNTPIFDAQLQFQLTEFQRYHHLKTQNGFLNEETYAQIGKEMSDIQIDMLSLHFPISRYSFYKIPLGTNLIEQKYAIVGFSESEYQQVNKQVLFMANTAACSQVFEDAGLISVNSMIFNGELVFVRFNLLTSSENNSKWGGSEQMRVLLDDQWRAHPFSGDVTPAGPQDEKYKYIVSLKRASFDNSVDTVPRVIIHALIHAGGAIGKDTKTAITTTESLTRIPGQRFPTAPVKTKTTTEIVPKTPYEHDLVWMGRKYERIMEVCTPKS